MKELITNLADYAYQVYQLITSKKISRSYWILIAIHQFFFIIIDFYLVQNLLNFILSFEYNDFIDGILELLKNTKSFEFFNFKFNSILFFILLGHPIITLCLLNEKYSSTTNNLNLLSIILLQIKCSFILLLCSLLILVIFLILVFYIVLYIEIFKFLYVVFLEIPFWSWKRLPILLSFKPDDLLNKIRMEMITVEAVNVYLIIYAFVILTSVIFSSLLYYSFRRKPFLNSFNKNSVYFLYIFPIPFVYYILNFINNNKWLFKVLLIYYCSVVLLWLIPVVKIISPVVRITTEDVYLNFHFPYHSFFYLLIFALFFGFSLIKIVRVNRSYDSERKLESNHEGIMKN
jgi:hypothetical protein